MRSVDGLPRFYWVWLHEKQVIEFPTGPWSLNASDSLENEMNILICIEFDLVEFSNVLLGFVGRLTILKPPTPSTTQNNPVKPSKTQ